MNDRVGFYFRCYLAFIMVSTIIWAAVSLAAVNKSWRGYSDHLERQAAVDAVNNVYWKRQAEERSERARRGPPMVHTTSESIR